MVGLVIVGAACGWARPRYDAANSGFNPAETQIGAGNVGTLGEQYRVASATPNAVPQFVVARGHVFVEGVVPRAFDEQGQAGCSGTPRTCAPQWSLALSGVSTTPDAMDGVLHLPNLAYDADGQLYCFGAPKTCDPVWTDVASATDGGTVDPVHLHFSVSRSIGHGAESVSVLGHPSLPDIACQHTPNLQCVGTWAAVIGTGPSGGIVASPAIAGGRVFTSYSAVGAPTGRLDAFDGTKGSAPRLWSAVLPGVGGRGIAVSGGVVVTTVQIGSASELVAYDAAGTTNCSGTPKVCTPIWVSDQWTAAGGDAAPAIANGVVYRAVGTQLRAYDLHGVTGCSGAPKVCQKLWVGAVGPGITAPAVANGLVYTSSSDGWVAAFDAAGIQSCSATTRVCAPLWQTSLGKPLGAVEVADGRVFVPVADGTVRAYAPG